MSLKTKFFSIITLAAGVVVFSTGAFAQDNKTTTTTTPDKVERRQKGEHGDRKEEREGMRGHRGEGKMGGDMGMMRGINLTDAQKAQIKSIREANKPDKAKFEQLKAIREARKNGTPITDEQKQQLKAFREQAEAKSKSVHEQILGVLTAEQKAQIQTRRQEMKQKMQERPEHHTDKPAATDKPKTN